MCIPRQALLGGLISRISRDHYRPRTEDLRALLGAGLTADEIEAALRRLGTDEAMDCLVHVQELVAGLPSREDP